MISATAHTIGSRSEKVLAIVLWVGLAAAIANAVHILLLGLWEPLLDQYSFRQTQTALTVYWLLHGGPWIAYETPVLGSPWSVPFEFPIYQWIVAVLATTGVPLDGLGRIVTFAFYVATLWPLQIFFRAMRLPRVAFLGTAVLFMTAPMYLYWSRTFMIESCALFFSSLGLALLALFLRDRTWTLALGATVVGTIGLLTKATTFPAFAFVGGCLILIDLGTALRRKFSLAQVLRIVVPGLVITIPFIAGFAWVYYSDEIKHGNGFTEVMTAAKLIWWNFGPVNERFSLGLWDAIGVVSLSELFGRGVLPAFFLAGAAFLKPRFAASAVLAAVGFLIPFLAFSNLYLHHFYYQFANGIFAIAVVGIGFASLVEDARPYQYFFGVVSIGLIVAAQVTYFHTNYMSWLVRDNSQDRIYKMAMLAKELTPQNSALIGIGDEWSSVLPYYSQRKTLMLLSWVPPPLYAKLAETPEVFLGDRPLGGIVYCADQLRTYTAERRPSIEKLVANRDVMAEFGGCQLLSPTVRH